jgi:hypothetical protein
MKAANKMAPNSRLKIPFMRSGRKNPRRTAAPPKRGVGSLWILCPLGLSTSPQLMAKILQMGVVRPLRLKAKTRMYSQRLPLCTRKWRVAGKNANASRLTARK